MLSNVTTEYGQVFIAKEAIAKIVSLAAKECYGLVGMAYNDKKGFVELLTANNDSKGIKIEMLDDGIEISIYVIVQYGTRISTVADNVIERVKYYVEKQTGLKVSKVNINIKGVRVHK